MKEREELDHDGNKYEESFKVRGILFNPQKESVNCNLLTLSQVYRHIIDKNISHYIVSFKKKTNSSLVFFKSFGINEVLYVLLN